MTSDVEQRLLVLVSERSDVPVDDLTRGTLLDDLGFDSLVLVELAMNLRKEFGVTANDDDLVFVSTVGELLDVVKNAP